MSQTTKMMIAWAIAIVTMCKMFHSIDAFELELNVTIADGSFVITDAADSSVWMVGAPLAVDGFETKISKTDRSKGSDEFGAYEALTLTYADADGDLIDTSFLTYASDASLIVFEQHVLREIGAVNSTQSARTRFPSFYRKGGASGQECFSYHGTFPAMKTCTPQDYAESFEGGAPYVLYDEDLRMTVLSPLDAPKAHHMSSDEETISIGVKSTVDTIPAGWKQRYILSAGDGIFDGMMKWGDRVLTFAGRSRPDNRYLDDVHGKIGFWTDNGGFYHYALGNVSANATYEDVLPQVKAYHEKIGVPFGHWQFDSWFYPKDGPVSSGGGGGAVTNWTALPSVFPSGMAHIGEVLDVPIVMHNRQWSPISDYIKNLDFEWYISEKAAVPKDPHAFFEWFFKQQEGWRLSMYEQDWMVTEYEEVSALQSNISMGDLWLRGMAVGARDAGLTVQYCMPLPYDILAAAHNPAVTNARATNDYFHADGHLNWAVGATSLYYWPLGVLPFKDGFYSSSLPQVGGQTVGPEKIPDREALMATLSAAMVGPMDGIGLLNKSRIMTTCRQDGVVLKPERPVVLSDACFPASTRPYDDPSNCYVYDTISIIPGMSRFAHYHFNADPSGAPLERSMLNGIDDGTYVVYNWYDGSLSLLGKRGEKQTLNKSYEGHAYAIVSPTMGGDGHNQWALIGETNKFVSLSSRRFLNIESVGNWSSLRVYVEGVFDETIEVCAAFCRGGCNASASLEKVCTEATFSTEGNQAGPSAYMLVTLHAPKQ